MHVAPSSSPMALAGESAPTTEIRKVPASYINDLFLSSEKFTINHANYKLSSAITTLVEGTVFLVMFVFYIRDNIESSVMYPFLFISVFCELFVNYLRYIKLRNVNEYIKVYNDQLTTYSHLNLFDKSLLETRASSSYRLYKLNGFMFLAFFLQLASVLFLSLIRDDSPSTLMPALLGTTLLVCINPLILTMIIDSLEDELNYKASNLYKMIEFIKKGIADGYLSETPPIITPPTEVIPAKYISTLLEGAQFNKKNTNDLFANVLTVFNLTLFTFTTLLVALADNDDDNNARFYGVVGVISSALGLISDYLKFTRLFLVMGYANEYRHQIKKCFFHHLPEVNSIPVLHFLFFLFVRPVLTPFLLIEVISISTLTRILINKSISAASLLLTTASLVITHHIAMRFFNQLSSQFNSKASHLYNVCEILNLGVSEKYLANASDLSTSTPPVITTMDMASRVRATLIAASPTHIEEPTSRAHRGRSVSSLHIEPPSWSPTSARHLSPTSSFGAAMRVGGSPSPRGAVGSPRGAAVSPLFYHFYRSTPAVIGTLSSTAASPSPLGPASYLTAVL